MSGFFFFYAKYRKQQFQTNLKTAKKLKFCYAFLLPFAILFFISNILPMLTSIYYSFTNFNMLEKPKFIGMQNYINLFLQDDVNRIAIKNTFLIAMVTGPIGYIMAFLIASLINEMPTWPPTPLVVALSPPSLAANAYIIFGTLCRGDMYGWMNAWLIKMGFVDSPILWLTDPRYIMKIIIPVILWTSLYKSLYNLCL